MSSPKKQEIWCALPGWENMYEASSWGRVRSLDREVRNKNGFRKLKGKILKPCIDPHSYPIVVLCRNGSGVTKKVHTLVLLAFVGPRPKSMETCHLDGDRTNNKLENLQWGTHTENMSHRLRHGTSNHGERHGGTILTDADATKIRRDYYRGIAQRNLAKKYKVSRSTISHIINRKTWKHLDDEGDLLPSDQWETYESHLLVGSAAKKARRARGKVAHAEKFSAHSQTMTVREWSKELGISVKTLYTRLYRGWSLEQVFSAE